MNRHAPTLGAATAALVALAACAGTGDGPDAPTVPGVDRPFPRLADLPERPPVPDRAELRRMREELLGDRAAAGRADAPPAPEAGPIAPGASRPAIAAVNGSGTRSGGPPRVPALRPPADPIEAGRRIGSVRFASGSAAPDVRDGGIPARLSEIRRRCGGTLRVVAHARRSGDTEGRLREFRLAVRRANAVADRLRRSGAPAARTEVAVTGAPPGPVPPKTAEDGRVAVYLLDQTGNPPPDRRRTRWECRDGT